MIDNVLRLSAIFANMMAYSAFGLAVVIGVAGTAERTGAACHGCLSVVAPAHAKPVKAIPPDTPTLKLAFSRVRAI